MQLLNAGQLVPGSDPGRSGFDTADADSGLAAGTENVSPHVFGSGSSHDGTTGTIPDFTIANVLLAIRGLEAVHGTLIPMTCSRRNSGLLWDRSFEEDRSRLFDCSVSVLHLQKYC